MPLTGNCCDEVAIKIESQSKEQEERKLEGKKKRRAEAVQEMSWRGKKSRINSADQRADAWRALVWGLTRLISHIR